MSATSPIVHLKTEATGNAGYVRDVIKRFYFQRRLLGVSRNFFAGVTATAGVLVLLGIADFMFPIGRTVRLIFVMLLLVSVLGLITYALLSMTRRRLLLEMAEDIQRASGRKENSLVTFTESLEPRAKSVAQPYMLARLGAQARQNLDSLDLKSIAPRHGAIRSVGVFASLMFVLLALGVIAPAAFKREVRRILWLEKDDPSTRRLASSQRAETVNGSVAIDNVIVRVVPPAYSGLGIEEANGDGPVRALAGSQIEVELDVAGKFVDATIGFGGGTSRMRALGEGRYIGSFVAQSSGAFEARVLTDQSEAPPPMVRAVEVYADVAPEARIIDPASDQLLRGMPARPISVRWTARDDLGLSDVTLKYIKSRGEGDAAQFVNGVLPVIGERASTREWQGGATLDLARLGLQPGDTLVYWIEARDRNPSQMNTGRSSSLAVSIAAPEPIKLNLGDLGPNEIGRFLLSERMIIVHTEKLHAERTSITKEDFLRRAQDIAAEQRDFKNSFNEYIHLEGAGEETHDVNSVAPESVEQQVQEAEAERTGIHMHGIPEPPQGSSSSVRDMVYAIRAMWDAEDALSLGDTAKALVFEREALTRLKRAQVAVRYIPPVAAISKPVDLKRRYAGELNEIKTRLERLSRPAESKENSALRSALAESYAALAELQSTLDVPVTARASAIARARERTQQSADNLTAAGGEHASTIAEALGQLRIVYAELARVDAGGTAEVYATRISKSMSLLTQAASNLFAIAEARTRATSGDASTILPADDRRTSDYFRRLNK